MKIDELRKEQLSYYNKNKYNPEKFKISKINPDTIIPQLCFIVHYLNQHGYTLTYICINDFEMSDDIILLKEDRHIVEIDSKNSFIYHEIKSKDGICFPSNNLKEGQPASIFETYASVGLFVYYLYYKKIMKELSEKDYGKLKGTKIYYFIKNTMNDVPCLIYL
jgi:hypothetical protein